MVKSGTARGYASKSGKNEAPREMKVSESSTVVSIAEALRSMMKKDNKVGKNEIRLALKQLKELDPLASAQVLKTLSQPLDGEAVVLKLASTDATDVLRSSKMGPIVEESLARLLEVGFARDRLSSIFSHLLVVYPEWRVDGWDNVIERFVANKAWDSEEVAFILSTLPRDFVGDFAIDLAPRDVIAKYRALWKNEDAYARYHAGTPQSAFWPASFYGRILGKFAQKRNLFNESASIVAHLTFHTWSNTTHLAPMQSNESFCSSVYFAAVVLASLSQTFGKSASPKIAEFLNTFNGKLIAHLKANPDIVTSSFNTYEYLEWIAILVSETSKRRGSKFNDLFLIKKCLDVLLQKWSGEDIALVSSNIGKRFGLIQFIKEMAIERKQRL